MFVILLIICPSKTYCERQDSHFGKGHSRTILTGLLLRYSDDNVATVRAASHGPYARFTRRHFIEIRVENRVEIIAKCLRINRLDSSVVQVFSKL
jgi:hypothetical protein